jgi:hypothetical protein
MSHVAEVKCEIRDLNALGSACAALNLTLDLTKRRFKWYGRHVGDHPLPEGFQKHEMGTADVGVISDPQSGKAYEVGVCKRRDGKEGYCLMYDAWQQQGPGGIEHKIGTGAQRLVQHYAEQTVRAQASRQGYMMGPTEKMDDGSLRVLLRTT